MLCFEALPGQQASLSWYPPIIKFEHSGRDAGRWTEVKEIDFSIRHTRHIGGAPNNTDGLRRGPLPAYKWKNAL